MTVTAAVLGAVAVIVAYLVYAFGKYRHAQQSGVVDMHDYQDARLQIIGNEALEDVAEKVEDDTSGSN